ncbi:winged helix-turn-helix domain-containing protein [Streptomyces sp. RG80]|uniref:winged helix-turn-helix domain-containing protein n=1 Tax=Streptomyces sp. RG80 TaxID=3157340 RepID=UPI00338D6A68
MADGSYPLNSLLPPQRHLAEELGVSRDTVQRVLRELRAEGWIETRQGMGTRVVRAQHIHSLANDRHPEGTVTLRSVIDRAFGRREVTLDVFTLTCESLDAHLRLQIERIRAGEIAPRRITLRVLSPAQSLSLPYWRTSDLADDELQALSPQRRGGGARALHALHAERRSRGRP